MKLTRGISVGGMACNIVGALLVLAGIGLVAMTTRSQLGYRVAAERHGGEVVNLDRDANPQAGQHGTMVRLVGTPQVVEAPSDPDFNLRVSTSVLVRHVEMFQWREIRIGDIVHYEQDWVDRPLDASHFAQPAGHLNPTNFPLSGKQFDAGLVQLGGFKFSPQLLHALPGSEQVTPDPKLLPENLAASFSVYQDYLVTSTHPGDPRLGDLRVSWEAVPVQEVTIIARIDGDRLVPAVDAADGKGYDVEVGNVPLIDVFPDLPVPPKYVMVEQLLAVLLATLGAFLLLVTHRDRRDGLLALALGMLTVGTVASVLWLGRDALMLCTWLALALLGFGIAIWRLQRKS
jgi:hypothetical protein